VCVFYNLTGLTYKVVQIAREDMLILKHARGFDGLIAGSEDGVDEVEILYCSNLEFQHTEHDGAVGNHLHVGAQRSVPSILAACEE